MAIIVVVLSIGLLAWFFLAPAGPARERAAPVARISESAVRLAIMTDGSTLTACEVGTGRRFSLTKENDTGGVEQTLTFRVSEEDWSFNRLDAAVDVLRKSEFAGSTRIEGMHPSLVVCAVVGRPQAIGVAVGELLATLRPALGMGPEGRFDLVLTGATNYAIWRRLNVASLKKMGEAQQPWAFRVLSRYHLRKHDDEK